MSVSNAVLPEAIGDLFLLLDFLTEANSQRLKFLINILLILMTGSWLGTFVSAIKSDTKAPNKYIY
ncbi:MAG: hypothetical protein A3E82_07265 [Gammaproteobacteria bacterium RIFCSPHIGHO2_12_FULL_38_11]|nr:MAG: hypothetical protein A3E82_07265 [Gammaproteobacteria bacterium RIFCSPHIGHO2_12_FULL_38_11]